MTDSQYSVSSSNSSNKFVPAGSGYQTPSYGQTGYTGAMTGLSGSGVRDSAYNSSVSTPYGTTTYGNQALSGSRT